MDLLTARILDRETGRFYRLHADSFSSTRHAAWAGWNRAFAGEAGMPFAAPEAHVLDVACGNLRFERYLSQRFPACRMHVRAFDNCRPLVGEVPADVEFRELGLFEALVDGTLDRHVGAGRSDAAVCFGYLHHVPGSGNRADLLRVLARALAPGGRLVVSFWQFSNSPELAARARASHERGLQALGGVGLDPVNLEPGDYLLGWQDSQDAFRYCHSFDAHEIDCLVEAAGLGGRVVDRFEADGRTGNLNAYLVIAG